jgi:hypothetical protein
MQFKRETGEVTMCTLGMEIKNMDYSKGSRSIHEQSEEQYLLYQLFLALGIVSSFRYFAMGIPKVLNVAH